MDNPMLWVGYPRSYTPGRTRPVRFVTLHYTAGSEGPTSAEAGAQYDKIRTDGVSCHAFFDSAGPGLQELPFGDRSHTAFAKGNAIGVHFEICGTRQTRAQWLDAVSYPTLVTTALATRYACETLGLDYRRHLSVAETRRAWDVGDVTGINDHAACTYAFPEDGGNHTDVGTEFPWDVFMKLVLGTPAPKEDDVGVYIQWGAQPNIPTSGYFVPGRFKNGKPVIVPLTDTNKINNWRAGGIAEKWPPVTKDNPNGVFAPNSAYWHINPVNQIDDDTCPPCSCECKCADDGDGGVGPHTHDVSLTGTTGPVVPNPTDT